MVVAVEGGRAEKGSEATLRERKKGGEARATIQVADLLTREGTGKGMPALETGSPHLNASS
jgi:hypothetical protein